MGNTPRTTYLGLILAGLFAATIAQAQSVAQDCVTVHLRAFSGWWLSINRDGSGSYGFGAVPASIEVLAETFDYETIFAEVESAFTNQMSPNQDPYTTVSCFEAGQSSAIGYRMREDELWLARLFLTASVRKEPPSNPLQEGEYAHIEQFWQGTDWDKLAEEAAAETSTPAAR